jgi:DNA-binding NtrC family response regulator
MEMVQSGEFRDDLYYRLKVIFIETPPLRLRKEDIPVLANHFVKEQGAATGRTEVGLSRGALEKLMQHDWPGNVRELKNCITRALAFADGDVLYAEDLMFDASASQAIRYECAQDSSMDAAAGAASGPFVEHVPPQLLNVPPSVVFDDQRPSDVYTAEANGWKRPAPNYRAQESEPEQDVSGQTTAERLECALRLARERGRLTRGEYQSAVGKGISPRTAQYDLQTLVKNGKLRKIGKGPATQYVLT